jgi:cyclophilin family peptidyl-prolyl cis-trans isomerase
MRKHIVLTLLSVGLCLSTAAQDTTDAPENPEPRVRVVTEIGDIVLRLDRVRAPLTVKAFLEYVDSGHYEGTIFHRVIPGFIAQTGGYTPDFELKPTTGNVVNESGNGLSNLRGTIGFARSNDPHSGTSQFYINLADNLDLNPRPTRWGYTVFGTVEEGMEIVDEIGHRPTGAGGPFPANVPIEPVLVDRIERLDD